MPAKIKLSHVNQLGYDFATAVAAYKATLKDFGDRPADWDAIPAPLAPHPLVAFAASFESYEVVDDTPKPKEPTLDELKLELAGQVDRVANQRIEQIDPPLKRPLQDLELKEARQTRWDRRTLAQREALHNAGGREARIHAMRIHAAELLSEIHDLTPETLKTWKPRPFPEPDTIVPSLEQRKLRLADEVTAQAVEAMRQVLPPLKVELVQLQAAAAQRVPEAERDAAQKAAMARQDELQQLTDGINLHAAKLRAEIADLTEASIESWRPKLFPGLRDPLDHDGDGRKGGSTPKAER